MSLRERLGFPPKGADARQIENYGWERVWLVLSQHWLKLIGLNLLYLLCCVPVVTIPAATCAMHRVILNWVRTRFDGMLEAFFREFRTQFFRRACYGLLLLLVPISLPVYPLILHAEGGTVAVFAITAIVYFCVSHYFYPLVVLLDVPLYANLKNACIMAVVEWRTTVQMLATAGVLDLMLLVLTAYAVPLYIIILFAFNCLLCCSFFNRVFAAHFESGADAGPSRDKEELP